MTFTNLHVDLASVTGVLPVASGGTNSSTALTSGLTVVSSAGKLVEGTITSAQLLSMPYWTKYTVLYSALSFAGTSNDITLLTLPSKAVVHGVVIKHSVAFSGGSLTTYTLSVGIVGTLAKYIAAFDVFQAVANGTFGASGAAIPGTMPESLGATTAIRVAAVGSHNLSTATAGSADIWVQTSLLP